MEQLYINGIEIELSPKDPTAFTFNTYEVASIEPLANYTNRFTIPFTNNNNIAFNFSEQVGSQTNLPYRKLPCTYIVNGVVIVQNGTAILDNVSASGYEVTIYSGIFDVFEQLGEKTLQDLEWSDLNHYYGINEVKTLNENYWNGSSPQSNVCFPLMDWGAYTKGDDVDIKYQQPVIRYRYILDKIFDETGYTFEGLILDDDVVNSMGLTISPDETSVSDEELLLRSFWASLNADKFTSLLYSDSGGGTVSNNNTGTSIVLVNVLALFNSFDEADNFDSSTFYKDSVNPVFKYKDNNLPVMSLLNSSQYYQQVIPPLNKSSYKSNWFQTITVSIHLWSKYYFLETTNGTTTLYPYYYVLVNNKIKYQALIDFQTGERDLFENEFTLVVDPGDVVKVLISAPEVNFLKQYNNDFSYVKITAENSLLYNSVLNYNGLVPEIKLKDFVRDFFSMFALIMNPKQGKQIELISFGEIKRNIEVLDDWSLKLDLTEKPQVSFRNGNFAQKNNYKYKQDDETKGYGDSFFEIDDDVLNPETTIIELQTPSSIPFNDMVYTSSQPSEGNSGVSIPRYTLFEADVWNAITTYSVNDVVNFNGVIYFAFAESTNVEPGTNTDYWRKQTLQYEQTTTADSRLVLIRRLGSLDTMSPSESITYTDQEEDVEYEVINLPFAFFEDSQLPISLHWNYLLANYYTEFIQMMENYKEVGVLMNLSEIDIQRLNFTKLKYVNYFGNLFYLSRVNDYLPNQSSKVNLIKI